MAVIAILMIVSSMTIVLASLDDARSLALMLDRESRRANVWREGHLASSEHQLSFYFEVAKAPYVKTVCEVGFNAGHSAAVFLIANPNAHVISFDLGQFDYSIRNLKLLQELYPERFTYVLGDSAISVPAFAAQHPHLKCDLIAIDGDHSERGALADIMNMAKLAACRNWVLVDDTGFKEVNSAWQRAKDMRVVYQSRCLADLQPDINWQFLAKPEPRSWCLGWFSVNSIDCPSWFDEGQEPYSNVTKCDIIA